jgi:hypothetical protein
MTIQALYSKQGTTAEIRVPTTADGVVSCWGRGLIQLFLFSLADANGDQEGVTYLLRARTELLIDGETQKRSMEVVFFEESPFTNRTEAIELAVDYSRSFFGKEEGLQRRVQNMLAEWMIESGNVAESQPPQLLENDGDA